jgi:hypothetical protein
VVSGECYRKKNKKKIQNRKSKIQNRKMNWGHGILIVIIVFLAGMLGMVFYASMQTNEMIDDQYYQKELEFQSVIDAQQNLLNLSENNLVSQGLTEVIITFPQGSYEKLEQGTIELIRNDDQQKDVQIAVQPNGYAHRTIPKSSLSKGMYKARIKWTSDGRPYYKEENVYVE